MNNKIKLHGADPILGLVPEDASHTDLRPNQSGYEIYWERKETKGPENEFEIYGWKRTVAGFIYLNHDGKVIGSKVREPDWERVKDEEIASWAEKQAFTTPNAEKLMAEANAPKFYMPGK